MLCCTVESHHTCPKKSNSSYKQEGAAPNQALHRTLDSAGEL
jgi:hypothetical protein